MRHARTFSAINVVSIGLLVAGSAPAAYAQQQKPVVRTPQAVWQQASLTSGRIRGIVRDDQGKGVSGVAISAMGTTSAVVHSDATGRFVLPLPSGEYSIRAYRDGYVSTYRDLVMVRPSTSLERTITRLAMFTQPISNTTNTPPQSRYRTGRNSRTVSSCRFTATVR